MQTNYTAKDIERFWSKVDKDSSTTFYNGTRCWEWVKYRNTNKYGRIRMGGRKGRMILAHRISFELTFGVIENSILVCHHCDNPPCCNPAHLFSGTQKENMEDRNKKGRQASHAGELNGRCKLSKEIVKEIRRRYEFGERNQSELSRMFNIDRAQIRKILTFESWRI